MSTTSTNNGFSGEVISDDYLSMRQRYGVDEVPGRKMGKFSPLCEDKKPQFFSMKTQLVTDGRSVNPLAETENLWAWIKVYASGGENTLHAHNNEDHMFVILQGTAIFHGPKGEKKEIGSNEGIMLPAGALYNFTCTSTEPLVLLRVGSRAHSGDLRDRVGNDGMPLPGGSKRNKFKPPVYADGKFFG